MLRIQPDEGISLRIGAKAPAPGVRISTVDMDFAYRRSFERSGGDAYEHLLLDCMLGDPTYFVRSDEVEAEWELIDRIEERWAVGCPPLAYYPAGSWGPHVADEMLARDGRRWHQPLTRGPAAVSWADGRRYGSLPSSAERPGWGRLSAGPRPDRCRRGSGSEYRGR